MSKLIKTSDHFWSCILSLILSFTVGLVFLTIASVTQLITVRAVHAEDFSNYIQAINNLTYRATIDFRGESYSLSDYNNSLAQRMMNPFSLDAQIKNIDVTMVKNIDEAKERIERRITKLQNNRREIDSNWNSIMQEYQQKSDALRDSGRVIDQRIANLKQTVVSSVDYRELNNQTRNDADTQMRKFEESIQQTIPDKHLPTEEDYFEPAAVWNSRIKQIYGNAKTELEKEIIHERLLQKSDYPQIRARVENNIRTGNNDPVFRSIEEYSANYVLAKAYLNYAQRLATVEVNTADDESVKNKTASSKIAESFFYNAMKLRMYASGLIKGFVIDTIKDNLLNNYSPISLLKLYKVTSSALKDPFYAYNTLWELAENFDGEKVLAAMRGFLVSKWDQFKAGNEEVRGQMIGQLLGEVSLLAVQSLIPLGEFEMASLKIPTLPTVSSTKIWEHLKQITAIGDDLVPAVSLPGLPNSQGIAMMSLIEDVTVVSGASVSNSMAITESAAKLGAKTADKIGSFAKSFKLSNPSAIEKIEEITTNIGKSPSALKAVEQTPLGRPTFYVNTEGKALPATAYRHIGADQKEFVEQIIKEGKIPARPGSGNYVTFERFENAAEASSKLQVPHDATYRVTLDTMENINDLRIPYGEWGKADWLEPFTKAYPDYGIGGASQAVTNSAMSGVLEIKNLVTGGILFKR
ncbi:MAG: hypothetical protein HQK53_11575 [Oligoflexia bacterium]|nr:hypothetical protein [Oligoflexia bacterium]